MLPTRFPCIAEAWPEDRLAARLWSGSFLDDYPKTVVSYAYIFTGDWIMILGRLI